MGLHFNGEMSDQECEAWKAEFNREGMTVWHDGIINDDTMLKNLLGSALDDD